MGKHFQGNVTVQPLVVRAIDHTHAAGAYLLENPVVAENFVNHADMLELCVHLMVSNKASQRARSDLERLCAQDSNRTQNR